MNSLDVHSATILIVDDQKSNMALLEQSLLEDGYTHILTTDDTEQVLGLHRENCFDLIMLDLDFPDRRGFQVLETMKTNIANTYLPVIVLTTHPENRLRALQAGAKDFINKPFDTLELLTRIRNILEVRLLYKRLEHTVEELEQRVLERTAELLASEERYRGFTDLASDWYWEQDKFGSFTKISGPVPAILGIEVDSIPKSTKTRLENGWNAKEQSILRAKISAHESFLDFEFTRNKPDGSKQTFLVSGQPMFDKACNFLGYRGVGVEISVGNKH